jgi:type III restriction enzyme
VRNDDLVLRVRTDFDPELIRLDRYEAFLDALCGNREYQKEAIRTICRFHGGGMYDSTSNLALENWEAEPRLQAGYASRERLIEALPFPSKLACTIDLATATGKSYVMYGVARILMAEGIVDRVLLLCPSLTIESGLREKFVKLSSDRNLTDLLPPNAEFRNPEITDANATTRPGDICIENIDATYRHVRSSVRSSFEGRGDTTLVLNDEAHHILSPPTGERAIKRWKEFLDSDDFGFRRIAGFSGTCYVGNRYIPDVVYQYSLRAAMDDGRVKEVRYVSKDDSTSQEERFQKYLQVHRDNQTRYPHLKPISILVAARVQTAVEAADDFTRFLMAELDLSAKDAERRVLVVTSKHPGNVAKLAYADRGDDPTEWIFSVSMLTEGWDVQNVFQIIPHEKRAFNSKLLIAQVLGRGLRLTAGDTRPVVWVFNHSRWAGEIRQLVDEVLEQEQRLRSYPVNEDPRDAFHFDLHDLTYRTVTVEQDLELKDETGHVRLFRKGYVNFESQSERLERQTVFTSARDHREDVVVTEVSQRVYTVSEAVQKIRARLRSIDSEGGTSYARSYPPAKLAEVIEASLAKIGEERSLVSEPNLQHLYRAIGNTQRTVARSVRVEFEPDQLILISTRQMNPRSASLTSFRKEATVFYDSQSVTTSTDEDQAGLAQITADDSPYPRAAAIDVPNTFNFKTPVNIVLTSHGPERDFVRRLFDPSISERLEAWVKAPDVGFYEIAYSWRKGDHTKQGKFNPDLFIKLQGSNEVLVVELKSAQAVTDENRAKLRFALRHFSQVNEQQNETSYKIIFLSPDRYDQFFQAVREGTVTKFVSRLQAELLD